MSRDSPRQFLKERRDYDERIQYEDEQRVQRLERDRRPPPRTRQGRMDDMDERVYEKSGRRNMRDDDMDDRGYEKSGRRHMRDDDMDDRGYEKSGRRHMRDDDMDDRGYEKSGRRHMRDDDIEPRRRGRGYDERDYDDRGPPRSQGSRSHRDRGDDRDADRDSDRRSRRRTPTPPAADLYPEYEGDKKWSYRLRRGVTGHGRADKPLLSSFFRDPNAKEEIPEPQFIDRDHSDRSRRGPRHSGQMDDEPRSPRRRRGPRNGTKRSGDYSDEEDYERSPRDRPSRNQVSPGDRRPREREVLTARSDDRLGPNRGDGERAQRLRKLKEAQSAHRQPRELSPGPVDEPAPLPPRRAPPSDKDYDMPPRPRRRELEPAFEDRTDTAPRSRREDYGNDDEYEDRDYRQPPVPSRQPAVTPADYTRPRAEPPLEAALQPRDRIPEPEIDETEVYYESERRARAPPARQQVLPVAEPAELPRLTRHRSRDLDDEGEYTYDQVRERDVVSSAKRTTASGSLPADRDISLESSVSSYSREPLPKPNLVSSAASKMPTRNVAREESFEVKQVAPAPPRSRRQLPPSEDEDDAGSSEISEAVSRLRKPMLPPKPSLKNARAPDEVRTRTEARSLSPPAAVVASLKSKSEKAEFEQPQLRPVSVRKLKDEEPLDRPAFRPATSPDRVPTKPDYEKPDLKPVKPRKPIPAKPAEALNRLNELRASKPAPRRDPTIPEALKAREGLRSRSPVKRESVDEHQEELRSHLARLRPRSTSDNESEGDDSSSIHSAASQDSLNHVTKTRPRGPPRRLPQI